MKKFPFKKITVANFIINVMIVLLSWNMLMSGVVDFVNTMVIHPNSFEFRTDECSGEKFIGPIGEAKFYINPDAIKSNPNLEQQLLKKFYIGESFFHLIQFFVLLFFLLQFKKIIKAIYDRDFYNEKTLKHIKNLAYLIFAFALKMFLAYQALGFYFPHSVIVTYYNYGTVLDGGLYSIFHSVNLFYIFFGILFLMFSTVLKGAIELKEQSDLTI